MTANALLPSRQPGPLAALAGVEVEEYYALTEPVPVYGKWLNGMSTVWAERLKSLDPDKTIPISFYGKSNGWLDEQVAVAVHPYGRGMVYTVGAYLDEAAQQAFIDHVLSVAGVRILKSPEGVEFRTRVSKEGDGNRICHQPHGVGKNVPPALAGSGTSQRTDDSGRCQT